jgi:mannose-1-phosphate guanylyltransferase
MRLGPDPIILCGGAGTRLRSVTDSPKAMASIGNRPFLELLLCQLRRWGSNHVILAVGYRGDAIGSYFGHQAFGLQLLYSSEQMPLGTGGGLRDALDLIQSGTALVMNGDSYTNADLQRFLLQHYESRADVSVLVVPPDGREDCGNVSLDESGRLLAFQEKQLKSGHGYTNAGIYLLSRAVLQEIPAGRAVSLERELLPKWIAQGKNIGSTIDPTTCYDIGTPERYSQAQNVLAEAEAASCWTTSALGQGLPR